MVDGDLVRGTADLVRDAMRVYSRGVCFWCFAIRFELSRGTVG